VTMRHSTPNRRKSAGDPAGIGNRFALDVGNTCGPRRA
jgi:hypothetical protein